MIFETDKTQNIVKYWWDKLPARKSRLRRDSHFNTKPRNKRNPEIIPFWISVLSGFRVYTFLYRKLPEKYATIEIDQFIVMPNYVHGIIFIVGAVHEPPKYNGAIRELPLQQKRRNMLLPNVIGYFKMNTAKHINEIRTPTLPVWQRNYYEHIIRNENELDRIREYILNNPLKWQFDRENPERVSDKQYEEDWK